MKQASVKLQELMMKRYEATCTPAGSIAHWDAAFICDGLYVGSLSATQDAEALRDHNIVAVLTVAGRLSVDLPEDILHLAIDIPDHPGADILGTLSTAVPFIDSTLLSDAPENTVQVAQQGILVHCASGISRSVSVCCAWLMLRKSMTFADALDQVRLNRPLASPNLGFNAQLNVLCTVLQKTASDLAVEEARREYKSKLREGTIMDVLFAQRNEANEIHAQVDELEESIKQAGDLTACAPALRECWHAQLLSLSTQLHALEDKINDSTEGEMEGSGDHAAETAETTAGTAPVTALVKEAVVGAFIKDKPAAMIRKAALSKIERLLTDIC